MSNFRFINNVKYINYNKFNCVKHNIKIYVNACAVNFTV